MTFIVSLIELGRDRTEMTFQREGDPTAFVAEATSRWHSQWSVAFTGEGWWSLEHPRMDSGVCLVYAGSYDVTSPPVWPVCSGCSSKGTGCGLCRPDRD